MLLPLLYQFIRKQNIMIKLAAYELSMTSVVLRFYLLMAVVIIAGFAGVWYVALLALPIFLSTMLGVKLVRPVKGQELPNTAKTLALPTRPTVREAA